MRALPDVNLLQGMIAVGAGAEGMIASPMLMAAMGPKRMPKHRFGLLREAPGPSAPPFTPVQMPDFQDYAFFQDYASICLIAFVAVTLAFVTACLWCSSCSEPEETCSAADYDSAEESGSDSVSLRAIRIDGGHTQSNV